ncbi:restriction endonuclease subunit S [Eggerthella lenta]|uniref:Restriction endonuclease subunit S n=1 Tax=Eggerthella lenta TaxID=84112 RepID=A0A844RDT5_EGGLN|nr:restriction endonuclease subunit S [Eggerthella lenta]MVN32928.1 restriction endonuclease subunit S [Eggerthella lenta]MVN46872.1 restriction endonuclease subunit S [Eggerthella lenta]MVN52690.1 restriction endonuclease subunit S [Eggerthella lenta]
MAEKQNTPEIRFEGFTDPWEQRKLGELGSVAMCKRIFKEQTTEQGDVPFYKIGTFGGTPDAFISRELFNEYQRLYQFPKVGDILISAAGTIGRTIVYQGDPAYYQDSNIVWLQHDERLDNGFLLQFLNGKSWSSLEGSTLKRLYNKDLLNAEIAIPSPDEQHQIGSTFAKLDDAITLHQRKHDKLCTVKKSMLDKMFPKPGETEPEIRFKGFTDPWEQRKFSNLTDRVSMQSSDPDLPQVEYEDIVSGEGTLNKDLRDKEGGKTGIKFYAGDVLYGKLRPYLMNWLYPQFNGVAVGDFWVLRATECDSSFLYRLVQTDSFQRLANVSSGSKMPRADWNLISQSFFAVPADYAEQRVIAKSLAELDNLITLHQRKLDLLKNTKKSLLDKMFV